MDDNRADTPEQVIEFAPKGVPRSHGTLVEEAGEAIVAKLQKAADLSNENCDRAMKLAHKLSRHRGQQRAPGFRLCLAQQVAEAAATSSACTPRSSFWNRPTVITLVERCLTKHRGCHAQTIAPTAKDHGSRHA
jgi:hypothetical protein